MRALKWFKARMARPTAPRNVSDGVANPVRPNKHYSDFCSLHHRRGVSRDYRSNAFLRALRVFVVKNIKVFFAEKTYLELYAIKKHSPA